MKLFWSLAATVGTAGVVAFISDVTGWRWGKVVVALLGFVALGCCVVVARAFRSEIRVDARCRQHQTGARVLEGEVGEAARPAAPCIGGRSTSPSTSRRGARS